MRYSTFSTVASLAVAVLCCFLQSSSGATEVIEFLDTRTTKAGTDDFYYDIGKEVAYFGFWNGSEYLLPNGRSFMWQPVFGDITVPKGPAAIVGSIMSALQNESAEYVALLGPRGAAVLGELITSELVARKHLVSFAANVMEATPAPWTDLALFVSADSNANLMALLAHMMNYMGVRRLAFIFIGDNITLQHSIQTIRRQFDGSEYSDPVYYTSTDPAASIDREALHAVLETEPQAILLFGTVGKHLTGMFRHLVTTLVNVTLLMPGSLRGDLARSYEEYVSTSEVTLAPSMLVFCTSKPIVTFYTPYHVDFAGLTHKLVEGFGAYMADGGQRVLEYCSAHGVHGGCTVDDKSDVVMATVAWGYVDTLAFLTALNLFSGENFKPPTAAGFQQYLYRDRLIKLEDGYMLGPYTGQYCGDRGSLGHPCKCNRGVHRMKLINLYLTQPNRVAFTYIPNSDLLIPVTHCNAEKMQLPTAVVFIGLMVTDDDRAEYMQKQYYFVGNRASQLVTEKTNRRRIGHVQRTTAAEAQRTLDKLANDFVASMLISPIPATVKNDYGIFIPDPIYYETGLHRHRRNHIYISTILEQELYVLALYLGGTFGASALPPPVPVGTVHAIVRAGEQYNLIVKLLQSFRQLCNLTLETTVKVGVDAPLVASLPLSGTSFIVGLHAKDIDDLAKFLEVNPNATVTVSFDELTLYYDRFVSAFKGKRRDAAHRMLFATSLPQWNFLPTPLLNSSSSLLSLIETEDMPLIRAKFLSLVPEKHLHTPAAFRSYLSTEVTAHVMDGNTRVSSTNLPDFFYQLQHFTVEDMEFGPYLKSCENGELHCDNMKYINYGARKIAVWPFSRALDPLVPMYTSRITVSIDFTLAAEESSSFPLWLSILLCVLGGLLGIVFVTLLLLFCCGCLSCGKGDARDNRNAPKDKDVPVTLVFTDIESSTALWALTPDAMKDAVEAHHKIIRALIIKHKCYEVKTIGDSFMIACGNAFSAVQLARDLQVKFLSDGDYDTSKIDAVYAEIREGGNDSFLTRESSGQFSNDAVWRGLRVRVGIHTGEADIQYDTVTKGYDYYGDTANIAARAESVCAGGQVVMTESTYKALARSERDALLVTALGPHTLRGVPFPVEMYQLDCVAGRVYPPLLTCAEEVSEDAINNEPVNMKS